MLISQSASPRGIGLVLALYTISQGSIPGYIFPRTMKMADAVSPLSSKDFGSKCENQTRSAARRPSL